MTVFFRWSDYQLYLLLLRERVVSLGVSVHAYCLMPNHVHLIVSPHDAVGLSRLFRSVHSQYAEIVNSRQGWKGHLWQQRFSSFPMDPVHAAAALEYVHDNPVRAGLVERPEDWPWSSARKNSTGKPDALVDSSSAFGKAVDPSASVRLRNRERVFDELRSRSRTGRPFGSEEFVRELELRLGRALLPRRRGPRPGNAQVSPSRQSRRDPQSEAKFGVW